MKRTIKLTGDRQRQHALQCVIEAPQGYCVTIAEETRTQEQNRLLWPLLSDIRSQVDHDGVWSAEQWKFRFLNELENEMTLLPRLDGNGSFIVGQRSSQLGKAMFSNLLEIIFAYGARNGVRWSAKSNDVFNSQGAGAGS